MSVECPKCGHTTFSCTVTVEQVFTVATETDPPIFDCEDIGAGCLRASQWQCEECDHVLDDWRDRHVTRLLDSTLPTDDDDDDARPVEDTAPL